MKTYETVLAALSDPTRRDILERLSDEERAVGELAEELPISRPAVSQHLRVLEGAGLVEQRREGTRRLYRARPEGLLELQLYLHRHWGRVLRKFQEKADERVRARRRSD